MKITSLLPLAFSMAIIAGFVTAGEDSPLTIDGEVFVTKAAAPAHLENVDEIFSGWTFRLDETQALQMDDFDNPAFVFVDQALDQFEMVEGSAGKACSSCHESAEVFSGLRASMPRVNSAGELETIPELISSNGSITGIKVDTGAKVLAGSQDEKITEGLDGLRERLE